MVCVDRKEAVPRFVRKPRNQVAAEGQTAKFDCKIIAASAPIITWSVLLCDHAAENFSLNVCLSVCVAVFCKPQTEQHPVGKVEAFAVGVAARLHLFVLCTFFLRGEGVRYIVVCVLSSPLKEQKHKQQHNHQHRHIYA